MTNDADFIKDFLIESYENLDKIDSHLLVLEKNPTSPESLAEIFRAFHTVKGTSRFFNFKRIEALTHEGEEILSGLREGRLAFDKGVAGTLLQLSDNVRALMKQVETTGEEGQVAASTQPMAVETAAVTDSTLRVGVETLDKLMSEVGELVLARNQLMARAAQNGDANVGAAAQKLNFIISELQSQVVKLRLQPMGSLWNRFPRLVRDLSLTLGKEVTLTMEGSDVELDKSILEAMKDPLVHLVRNAIDHGLETPEARQAAGKAPAGHLRLRAFQEGGTVNLEVADDGSGIRADAVRQAAIARGLITADAAGRLTEGESYNLIFTPGFSTAKSVTNVSGRGVGLDVVKTNIEKIGGTVDIRTQVGQGTVFRLRIPLTLAIVPALLVISGRQHYAIPQVDLLEMVRLRRGDEAQIEWFQDVPVYRLRGKLLPIVFLSHALGGPQPRGRGEVSIVVLQASNTRFGLVVDRVLDTEEIVVKPLGRHMKKIPLFEGATILGDGRAALILDVVGLAQMSGVGKEIHDPMPPPPPPPAPKDPIVPVLLCASKDNGRMAIVLADVVRLEEFATERFERSGGGEVVQYQEDFLPVLRISQLLEERRRSPRSAEEVVRVASWSSVVVCRHKGRQIGIVVDKIVDIVKEPFVLSKNPCRSGVKATMVLQGRVTELLDLDQLVAKAQLVDSRQAAR